MRNNARIASLFAGLAAAGVQHRCNWQSRRDGRAVNQGMGHMPDVEHLSFVGDGFAPSISTAILIDYAGEGYGLYVEADTNRIADDVAAISKPREPAGAAGSHALPLIDDMPLADLLHLASRLAGTTHRKGVEELQHAIRVIEKWAKRADTLLGDTLMAWEGEEESVKEEHADHIAELEAFVNAKPAAVGGHGT